MGRLSCSICGMTEGLVTSVLGICSNCIREDGRAAREHVRRAHSEARSTFSLPPEVPRSEGGAGCKICANLCRVPEGGHGFCGLRRNEGGRLVHLAGVPSRGRCEPYYDPLPTNCVAAWTCPGSRALGKRNLAVFYLGCSMDCLYCQNWTCRLTVRGGRGRTMSSRELADMVDERTACVCCFGGDPGPHSPHALRTADIVMEERPDVRICWETNGRWAPPLRRRMIETSLISGGIVKVDLKAGTDQVHRALTGQSVDVTRETIRQVSQVASERPETPLLVVSTLLVPGYVDGTELRAIAEFLVGLDTVPSWSLLAFHPDFEMRDLPPTSMAEARQALAIASDAGLEEAHVGNVHLLH